MKKIGGIFAFKVKDGPGGKEATWVVDVKNGRGSVLPNSGRCSAVMTSLTSSQRKMGACLGGPGRAGCRYRTLSRTAESLGIG